MDRFVLPAAWSGSIQTACAVYWQWQWTVVLVLISAPRQHSWLTGTRLQYLQRPLVPSTLRCLCCWSCRSECHTQFQSHRSSVQYRGTPAGDWRSAEDNDWWEGTWAEDSSPPLCHCGSVNAVLSLLNTAGPFSTHTLQAQRAVAFVVCMGDVDI